MKTLKTLFTTQDKLDAKKRKLILSQQILYDSKFHPPSSFQKKTLRHLSVGLRHRCSTCMHMQHTVLSAEYIQPATGFPCILLFLFSFFFYPFFLVQACAPAHTRTHPHAHAHDALIRTLVPHVGVEAGDEVPVRQHLEGTELLLDDRHLEVQPELEDLRKESARKGYYN